MSERHDRPGPFDSAQGRPERCRMGGAVTLELDLRPADTEEALDERGHVGRPLTERGQVDRQLEDAIFPAGVNASCGAPGEPRRQLSEPTLR